jgi:hypothetical protein
MANPQQGTIDSVSKIYQVVEKTQYAVPVLYCSFFFSVVRGRVSVQGRFCGIRVVGLTAAELALE